MKRHNCKLLMAALLLCAAGRLFGSQLPQGEWNCVALTPRHLALTGDYSDIQLKLFRKRFVERRQIMRCKLQWERELWFDLSATEAIAAYRPTAARLLRDSPQVNLDSDRGKIAVTGTGYWLSSIGQAVFPDENGKERFSSNADVAHHLFLNLSRPLADGEKLTITLPAGEKVDFTYRVSDPTPVFKINQIGYLPQARKFAYMGAWLGTAGKLPLFREFTGKQFRLIDAADGKTVHTGLLHPRPHDQYTKDGTPFTGEEILELDISDITRPGEYYFAVEGIGRSMTFRIGDDTMAEAFYIHARGLYHQRCGIARREAYTPWTMPACHETCIRGTFPPNIAHYSKGNGKRLHGFKNAAGQSMELKQFQLIADNIPAEPEVLPYPGGWHDAADWDRRPQHLGIVGDLCAVYLMKPENFRDGQLNLPESGNGVPDILDEACWGIEHLRLKQHPDGGVGTWIETTRHPRFTDGSSADDRLTYYLSCATRGSTIEYAAYTSELALALRRAGALRRAEIYTESAQRAWKFALNPANRVSRSFNLNGELIFYREETNLSPVYQLKAGINLFELTGDKRYLNAAEKVAKSASSAINDNFSPLIWIELELFQSPSAELNRLRLKRRKSLLHRANVMLRQQESNYPIRAPWYGVNEGWFHSMSWGTFHPLRRALVLIAAHALTGRKDFWDGACLANDFHNGANPSGSTMTSGLGKVYPVRFLDLNSYADGIAEPIPGITPYRNTFGIPREAVKMAFGLFFKPHRDQKFAGLAISLLPREGLSEDECAKGLGKMYPIWHRWANVESRTVAASEFTVWETIAPAAATTGYLLNGPTMPKREWLERRPADDIRKLPGYAPLP